LSYWEEYEQHQRTHEVRLKLRRYALEFSVSGRVSHFKERTEMYEHRHRLCLEVFTRSASHTVTFDPVSYPATWWQAFKQRFFPSWALNRWPVQLTTVKRDPVTVEAEALFPELEPVRGQRDMRIVFVAQPKGSYP
jgi:hypothetical protein